jgi:hypothetical protein
MGFFLVWLNYNMKLFSLTVISSVAMGGGLNGLYPILPIGSIFLYCFEIFKFKYGNYLTNFNYLK